MEKNKTEKIVVGLLLLVSVAVFFGFGLFHLTKFETTDEHLWKYGRIKQYWQAIGNKDWAKTYINDKPGVTIALFSGTGLLFDSSPEDHRNSKLTEDGKHFLKYFDTNQTELINIIFRLPILILATLSLFLFFWLGWKAFDSLWLALFSVMFLALNPILIGITQIINPDSYLWIFGGLSVFSYLAFLNKKERKFLILTGIFMGFAMLSKYTSIILFLFFILILLARTFSSVQEKQIFDWKTLLKDFLNLALIFIMAIAVFSIFLPAVFVHPAYLTKGVAQFFKRGDFSFVIIISLAALSLIVFFRKKIFSNSVIFFSRHKQKILAVACLSFLAVSAIMLINVWTGQKMIPFDELRDAAYANEPKKFYFGKEFKQLGTLEKDVKLFFLEAYPFIFSLIPLSFLLSLFLAAKGIFGKIKNHSFVILFSVMSFSLAYFFMTLTVRVVANVRYSIILQFLFALLSAVALVELLGSLKLKKKKHFMAAGFFVLVCGCYSLWNIRPFYFSYESPLLPKKFTINSSWGSGFYEAAQYLNSKPNAENMYIWSNSASICPFFKGKCIDSRKIDLNLIQPDYFVISKRGTLKERNKFIFTNLDYAGKKPEWYFDNLENNYEWALFIGDREENYVKIIKFEE